MRIIRISALKEPTVNITGQQKQYERDDEREGDKEFASTRPVLLGQSLLQRPALFNLLGSQRMGLRVPYSLDVTPNHEHREEKPPTCNGAENHQYWRAHAV